MRFMLKRLWGDKAALAALLLLSLIILIGISAPWLAPHDPVKPSLKHKFASVSLDYPLGADHLGRCVLSRLMFGVRSTVFTAVGIMAATIAIGLLVGFAAGYFRGRVDEFLMRLCDVMLSFPAEAAILALVGVLGPSLGNIVLAAVVIKWAWYSRMIRGLVLAQSENNYVRYARSIGAPPLFIMRRHLLPAVGAELAVLATTDAGSVILTISALSFLGLGVQAPTPEWGLMLSEAKNVMVTHPRLMLPAGLAIALTVAAFNFVGDFLRDLLDPKYYRAAAFKPGDRSTRNPAEADSRSS